MDESVVCAHPFSARPLERCPRDCD